MYFSSSYIIISCNCYMCYLLSGVVLCLFEVLNSNN